MCLVLLRKTKTPLFLRDWLLTKQREALLRTRTEVRLTSIFLQFSIYVILYVTLDNQFSPFLWLRSNA